MALEPNSRLELGGASQISQLQKMLEQSNSTKLMLLYCIFRSTSFPTLELSKIDLDMEFLKITPQLPLITHSNRYFSISRPNSKSPTRPSHLTLPRPEHPTLQVAIHDPCKPPAWPHPARPLRRDPCKPPGSRDPTDSRDPSSGGHRARRPCPRYSLSSLASIS